MDARKDRRSFQMFASSRVRSCRAQAWGLIALGGADKFAGFPGRQLLGFRSCSCLSGHDDIAVIGRAGHIDDMAITAAEHQAILEKDPAYQAMRRERDAAHAERVEQRRLEQQSLLKDLAAVGVIVDLVGRLCSFSEPDERIYPVLLDHLARPYSPHLLEWIGRAFGRKSARPIVWDTLVELIKSHGLEKSAVEGVMVAISDMAQPRDLATLIDLLSDRSIGISRIFLVRNLMRSKKPEARAALLRHREDPDLMKEITACLARRRG